MITDLQAVLSSFSPELQQAPRKKIAARINQLESILCHAGWAGIDLDDAEVSLIDSALDRLYLERARPVEVTDSLAIRTADACVSKFMERLLSQGEGR